MRPTLAPLILLPVLACAKGGQTDAAGQGGFDRVTERDLPEEGLYIQEIDLDGDGRAEVWNTYRERAAASPLQLQKKVDLNFDGRVDVVASFDDDGALVREELDGDFDGTFDWIDHYKDGHRVLAESDTDFDGRADVFYYYVTDVDGRSRIDRKERDTNADGAIDFWERFDAQGNVVRTGRDTDGDGTIDVRDE